MSNEHKVAQLNELDEGQMKPVEIDDTSVLLSKIDGEVYAVSGTCTHYGAPLEDGALHNGQVICPWHHACFDVKTGAHLEPPGLNALARFEVRVDGDDIFVTLPDAAETERKPEATSQKDDSQTFVILGGGIAGENAAEVLRDEGFTGRLVMITKEAVWPYDRTKLSKGLDAATKENEIQLRDEAFYKERDIERMVKEVTKVSADDKMVAFADGETLGYDALLVATGSTPKKLEIPGTDLNGVYTLRSIEDAQRILEAAKIGDKAVLIGSSFIALELASALQDQDVKVSIVAPESVPFEKILGEKVGKKVQANHEKQGTTFYLERKPQALEGSSKVERVKLDDGTVLDADFVIIGIGVTPVTDIVQGVDKADDGGIEVDETLKAADALYAAGDIAQFPMPRSGEQVRIEHWRLAAQHGRTAARNMLGKGETFTGVPYFWTAQPDLKLRYVGHAEDFDDIVYDGDVEGGEFIAYYVKDGSLLAAAGSGRDKELAALEHLMKTNNPPSADELKKGVDLLERLQNI